METGSYARMIVLRISRKWGRSAACVRMFPYRLVLLPPFFVVMVGKRGRRADDVIKIASHGLVMAHHPRDRRRLSRRVGFPHSPSRP